VTATLAEKAFVFNGDEPKTVTVQLNSFRNQVSGKLLPHVPEGWKVTPEEIDFSFKDREDQQLAVFTVRPGAASGSTLSLDVVVAGETYQQGLRVVDYDHIPVQTLFPFAEAKVEKVDLKFTGKRIGYINGAGDLIPESLKQIGYEVVMLTQKQVVDNDLSAFDAIITGVRLYNINEHSNVIQPKLMKYVENGGVLLVQYNVNSPLKINDLGPYPFRLTRDRVTEEDAVVDFLSPSDPALNYPNKITAKDFDGWVQERGLYFTTELDSHYTAVLGMHDQGESQKNGALITTNYGKGRFVYTGLSFFRQLPAGVPGAYRLFVNLISKPKGR